MMHMTRSICLRSALAVLALAACSAESKNSSDPDADLAALLSAANVSPLTAPAPPLPALFTLGQALMFDKILSGNRTVACATCHSPLQHTGDGLPLSVGDAGATIPRHAPDLFNRGFPQWKVMFWEGRVATAPGGGFVTPAGVSLPAGLSGVLAAQAMFPVTVREEMRGQLGDSTSNELATIPDDDFPAIWDALMQRLRAIPKYDTLFQAAYGISVDDASFAQVTNAIAAFQTSAFTSIDTPFDAYVAGDRSAMTDQQKRGARLFFGEAKCGKCHLGPLLTDQKFHNVLVPQLGPGRGALVPLDNGRAEVSGVTGERFAFRTPPLRNVALTAPYFHDGAFATLEAAVRHYINVARSLEGYDATQLPAPLQPSVLTGASFWDQIKSTRDANVIDTLTLNDGEVSDIVAFLGALTDPAALDLSGVVPASVPSGLPVGN